MKSEDTWKYWNDKWSWIIDIAKKNQWLYSDIKILPPVNLEQIEKLESDLKIFYPKEFKNVLQKHSAGVIIGWQLDDQEFEGEFRDIFSGAGGVYYQSDKPFIWNFHELKRIHSDYIGWITDCYNDPNDNYGKYYHNKVPFLDVPNGDLIVFNDNGNVICLSHDDGPLHGKKLADNFEEFITLWSQVGCVGTESEQFQVFYDNEKQKLIDKSEKIDRWINLIENKKSM